MRVILKRVHVKNTAPVPVIAYAYVYVCKHKTCVTNRLSCKGMKIHFNTLISVYWFMELSGLEVLRCIKATRHNNKAVKRWLTHDL